MCIRDRVNWFSASVARLGSARAEKVLERQLVEAYEAEALATEVRVGVEVLIGGTVGEKVLITFARGQGGLLDLANPGSGESLLYLGVGAECRGAPLEQA